MSLINFSAIQSRPHIRRVVWWNISAFHSSKGSSMCIPTRMQEWRSSLANKICGKTWRHCQLARWKRHLSVVFICMPLLGTRLSIGSYATEPFAFLSLLNCLWQFILLWARKFTLLFCFWKLSDINDKVVLNSAVGFILGASFFGMPRRRKGTQRFLCCFWVVRHFQIFSVSHDADEHTQHLQVAFVCFSFYHFPFWCTGKFSFNNMWGQARSSFIFSTRLCISFCFFRDGCETRGGFTFSFIILLTWSGTLAGCSVSYNTVLRGSGCGTCSYLIPD